MPEQAKTIYANCLGLFVFDEQHKMIDKELFDTDAALKFLTTKELSQNKIVKKYSGAKIIGSEELPHAKVLEAFRNEEFFKQFYDVNILFAKQRIKQSFTKDQLIVQSVAVI
ncbi:MAG: hypothetical protein KJ574_01135 [Nanoarchaeota archaeon]|nr:hypothetical protein [Nanoarchaeota archaeon]